MPFATNTGYAFEQQPITLNAPTSSGVYGIYRQNVWIHVGESNDIQRRLAEHLTTAGTCILRHTPTGFTYELVAGERERKIRQNQLILELKPVCSERLG